MVYKLKCKDINKVLGFLSEAKDLYEEWYITINNKRVFLRDPKVLNKYFNKIKFGEVILTNYEETGFIYTWGKAEKSQRVYLKIMATDPKVASQMIQVFNEKFNKINLYTKIKKDNPMKSVFISNGFVFKGGRGKEILLAREVIRHD